MKLIIYLTLANIEGKLYIIKTRLKKTEYSHSDFPNSISGYNGRTPNSPVGKIAAMILALLGLPILFIYLTVVGSSLARMFRRFYSFVCCCCCTRRRGRGRGGRPPASNNSTLEKSGASSASDQVNI